MRFLVRLAVIFAVLWCAWWALASFGAHWGLTGAIAAREGDGWRAEVRQAGFPFRIRSDLTNVVLTDPGSDIAVEAEALSVSVPTYWPGYLSADLPETPVRIRTAAGEITVELSAGDAGVNLAPGTALELDSLRVLSGPWRVLFEGQEMVKGQALVARMTQDAERAARYDAVLQADRLTLGKALREPLRLDLDWPSSFDAFAADLSVTFDRPLDRTAGQGTAPQPRAIALRSVDLRWGELALNADGTLLMDSDGMPEGSVTVQLRNWRTALDIVEDAGALPASARGQADVMLGALANRAGSPEDIDLTVDFRNGRLIASGIDLGAAPRIAY